MKRFDVLDRKYNSYTQNYALQALQKKKERKETMAGLHPKTKGIKLIRKNCKLLSEAIWKYEQTDFSSKEQKVTLRESRHIAARMIEYLLANLNGIVIKEGLDDLRFQEFLEKRN